MKSRGLLIAAIVLLALSGVMFWSNRHQPTKLDQGNIKLKEVDNPKILAFDHANIAQLSIHRKDQPQVELYQDASGSWQITAPTLLAADQNAVTSLLTAFSSLNADRVVDDKPGDLTPFGLKPPVLELDATLKDKSTRQLLIGDQTPAGNSYYVMLAGDPRLFTFPSFAKANLDKSANDLRDKRLLTADFDKVSQIDLATQKSGHKQEVSFARSKDAWQILKPTPFPADASHVEDLIRELKRAKLDASSATDATKDAGAFKSAAPFATIKVVSATGSQELEIRKAAATKSQSEKSADKSKDTKGAAAAPELQPDYYAKSSVVSGFYKVPASLATALDKPVDDYRDRNLFSFGYTEPDKIEIHDGAKSYFLTHSGSDWWSGDGKKLDDATVQPLLENIRALGATNFPDSGFANPALDITVTSASGRTIEKVLIAPSGDHFIAKRNSEPSLYELPSASVTDLQKSAAALKPTAPAAPAKK
jgi:hypothetical protein